MSCSPSVEALVRDALRQWVCERPWSTEPMVTAEEPEPGDKPALPTLACWFDRVDVTNPTPIEVAPGLFNLGHAEARVTFIYRCASRQAADTFCREWRDLVWTAAMDASPTGLAPVLPFTVEVDQERFSGKLYLDGSTELAAVADTQVRGLWIVRVSGTVCYPVIGVRAPTGLMTVSLTVEVGGFEFQAADFQAPRVLSSRPEPGGEVALDEPVELVFDQPMQFHTVERAVEGFEVVDSEDLMTFSISPPWGAWAVGPQTITIAQTARSRRGTPLAAPVSLSFIGVAP